MAICTQHARPRVLLVEDTPLHQKLATALLERQGCDVVISENGQLAVERLESEEFDLVLMDIEMPVMDGYKATEAIRQREDRCGKHTPVFAVTSTRDIQHCIEAGMDGHIPKPLRVGTLKDAMDHIRRL